MATRTYSKSEIGSNYPGIYTSIGWQVSELNNVITKLNKVRDKWDDSVYSTEPFYNSFITDIDNLISHLNSYKSYMETKGSQLKQYAKWAD